MAGNKQYIGVLDYNNRNEARVFINSNNKIQFAIKMLHNDYKGNIHALCENIENGNFEDNEALTNEERVAQAISYLKDLLFLFFVKEDKKNNYAQFIEQIEKPEGLNIEENYINVPVFSAASDKAEYRWNLRRVEEGRKRFRLFRTYEDIIGFDACMKKRESVGRIYGYDVNHTPSPSFVIWREEQRLCAVGMITGSFLNEKEIVLEGSTDRVLDLTEFAGRFLYAEEVNPTMVYIPEHLYESIEAELRRIPEKLVEEETTSSAKEVVDEKGLSVVKEVGTTQMNIKERKQYLGILDYNQLNEAQISITQQNEIQFMVRVLEEEESQDRIPAVISKIMKKPFIDNLELSDADRRKEAEKFLQDKLCLFFIKEEQEGYKQSTYMNLINKPEGFNEQETYVSVPVFAGASDEEEKNWQKCRGRRWSLYRNYECYNEWEDCIAKGESVGRIYGYGNNIPPLSFVIWREDKKLNLVGLIENCAFDGQELTLQGQTSNVLDVTEIKEKFLYDENVNPTLAFLPTSLCSWLEDKLRNMTDSDEILEIKLSEIEQRNAEEETIDEEPVIEEPLVEESVAEELAEEVECEEIVIGAMRTYNTSRKWEYRRSDLVNFHLCVKCNPFVVLDGRNGTGKTSLVELYIKALGRFQETGEKNVSYTYIPVRASWSDEISLLGKVDYDNKMYRPSESGFIEALIKAQENPDKLTFICLDDMNLSRPEMYLAPFLAVMNKPVNERILKLYDSELEGYLQNSDRYPDRVMIGDNVRVIGILSEEESAEKLSIGMLRRVNVIHLDGDMEEKHEKEKLFQWVTEEPKVWTSKLYNGFIERHSRVSPVARHVLEEIDKMVQRNDSSCMLTAREEKEIFLYLSNASKFLDAKFSVGEALDYQIAQRILTKVRGSSGLWGAMLEEDKALENLFNKYGQISEFRESRRVLKKKREELKRETEC